MCHYVITSCKTCKAEKERRMDFCDASSNGSFICVSNEKMIREEGAYDYLDVDEDDSQYLNVYMLVKKRKHKYVCSKCKAKSNLTSTPNSTKISNKFSFGLTSRGRA